MNLIHLSDIHFHKGSGGVWDLDKDLRHQLEVDLSRVVDQVGSVDAVLVTGDIAFSADRRQFDTAIEWLDAVAEISRCPRENIWVAPGNHDVDRSIAGSMRISVARDALRNQRQTVDEALSDSDYAGTFFEALKEYNHFAANYSCQIGPEQPVWHASLPLGDSIELVLCGLNTTLVSGPEDHESTGRMLVGPILQFLPSHPGRVYLTLAHHPLPWMLDHAEVHGDLQARVAIQLFGHTHSQVVDRIGNSLRIVAGATHPSRNESGWLPRYNVLQLGVGSTTGERWLDVALHSRVWKPARRCFGPCTDRVDTPPERFRLGLPLMSPVHSRPAGGSPSGARSDSGATVAVAPPEVISDCPTQRRPAVDPYRALVRRFLKLPVHFRYRVLVDEGLLPEDSEPPAPSNPEWASALSAAREDKTVLTQIWARTQGLLGEDEPNPFGGEVP